jgi:replicative DNA helicase
MAETKKNKNINKTKADKSKTDKGNIKLTPYEEELVKASKKVKEYLVQSEANIVLLIYQNPEILYDYDLKLEYFHNNIWRVFYAIAEGIVLGDKKSTLDAITVGLYLEKHPKLAKKYEDYHGYSVIENGGEYIKIENLQGYINDLNKWNCVLKLLKQKFPVFDRLSEFADMTLSDIYGEYESILSHTFINAEEDVKTYNGVDGMHELIDEYNAGILVGLPLNDAPLLNKEISGLNRGHIYGCGAGTGIGKSSSAIHWLLPSVIEYNEKILLIINEEDERKVRSELLIYVVNNVFKVEFKKYKLRDGKYSKEDLEILRKAADWLEEKKESRHITIVPLERYTTSIAIKLIKKYANFGIKFILLDTLKPSADSVSDNIWLQMQRDMVDLYNVIKPSNKNVTLWVNYQLGKSALKRKYLTNDDVGLSKSILDVMSANIMIRTVLDSELEGQKEELCCFKIVGKSKIPFKLKDSNKRYVIIFLTKTRFGEGNIQIVAEHNLSTNKFIELGYCRVVQDF